VNTRFFWQPYMAGKKRGLSRTLQRSGRDNSQVRPSAADRMTFERGLNQRPTQHARITNHGDSAAGAFQPVQGVQPRIEQRMALPECAYCLGRIVGASLHESRLAHVGSQRVAQCALRASAARDEAQRPSLGRERPPPTPNGGPPRRPAVPKSCPIGAPRVGSELSRARSFSRGSDVSRA